MKKKVCILLVTILIGATVLPVAGSLERFDMSPGVVDQEQLDTSEEDFLENGVIHYQQFINQGKTIEEIEVHIAHYFAGSKPMTLSVQKPIGNILTSKTLTTADIPDHVEAWCKFDLPDKPLTRGGLYYIVIEFDIGSEYVWSGAHGDPYPSGASSHPDADWDYAFRTIVDKARTREKNIPKQIVDQSQPICDDCRFLPNYGWQEFVPQGKTLQTVDVCLAEWYGGSPDITLSIEKPLGTSLSSKTLPVSAINSGQCDWVSFDIPDISLSKGATYYIVISYPPGGEYGWCGAWGNPYASGVSDVDPDWDYTFRTIVEKARPRIVNIFINFLENHPNLFPMLRQLLKL